MTAEKSVLKCRHCTKKFKYDSERRRHEQSHSPQFQCKVCEKNFSFMSALRRHEKQHERTERAKCGQCSKEFKDDILLKRHIKYAHAGTHTCSKCSASFSSDTALKTHMKTHKAESERRFKCSYEGCSKKFNFPHHLKHHELTHSNVKQHFCKICGKGFIQRHHLKTHYKTHNITTSLYCDVTNCNKTFSTEYARKRHIETYHTKADSGVSSDSSSNISLMENATTVNNDVKYPSYTQAIINNNILNCGANVEETKHIPDIPEHISDFNELESKFIDDKAMDEEIINCKSALGSCITEKEKCVCAQISKTIDETSDFTPIENEVVKLDKMNIDINACESCECSGHCDIKKGKLEDTSPIEYKTDGTIKIKDCFDIDFPIAKSKTDDDTKNDVKFFPYNSCKAILGNCIVSGNGTIGDGCLCAKMLLEEQATAQEIEDITPHPNNELLCDLT